MVATSNLPWTLEGGLHCSACPGGTSSCPGVEVESAIATDGGCAAAACDGVTSPVPSAVRESQHTAGGCVAGSSVAGMRLC